MSIPTRMVAVALTACLSASGVSLAQETESSKVSAGAGGWAAYLDPATGKLMNRPPYGQSTLKLSREELNMFSTDDFGLIERVMPDGGVMIDLRGRFRKGTVARVTNDGRIVHQYIGGEIFLGEAGKKIRALMRDTQDAEPGRTIE